VEYSLQSFHNMSAAKGKACNSQKTHFAGVIVIFWYICTKDLQHLLKDNLSRF
jgi:hypothetical protein